MSTEMPISALRGGASSCCGWDRLLPSRIDPALFFMFLHGCEAFSVHNLITAFEFTRRPAIHSLGNEFALWVTLSS
eukprot:1141273-Pelagomonas_calceolata.AAC.1